MNIRLFILTIILGLISVSLYAQENYKLRKITFHGNKVVSSDDLKQSMAAKEVSWLQQVFDRKETYLFNSDLMDLDLRKIRNLYHREGFMQVKDSCIIRHVNHKRQTLRIEISITEGIPFRVDSIHYQFPKIETINNDSLTQAIKQKSALHHSSRFVDEKLVSDIDLIKNSYRNRGYAYASADYKLNLDTLSRKVTINYTANPGPLCKFGNIKIFGNKHVAENSISKQISFKSGQLYNREQLNQTRENLYGLQLFRIVSVTPQKDNTTKKTPIPIHLFLTESSRINSKVGIGYGTEDKIRAYAQTTFLGIFHTTSLLNLYVKHSDLVPYYFSLKWIQPKFLGLKSTLTVNPFIKRNSEPGYETRTYGVNLPLTYQVNSHLTSTLTFYRQDVKEIIEDDDADIPGKEDDDYLYNKSGFILSEVYSTASPKFNPTHGFTLSGTFKVNGYLFGTDFNYSRLWADLRKYQSFGNLTIALRAMAGGIHSSDADQYIPVEDRFYSGGSNSVRGWSRSMLGPLRSSGTPLGGKSILEGNIELRFPLVWKLSAVAFMDTGNVWENSYTYQFNELAFASGGGLRVATPIGPIRLDVGVPVWDTKKSPQIFISVGQAF